MSTKRRGFLMTDAFQTDRFPSSDVGRKAEQPSDDDGDVSDEDTDNHHEKRTATVRTPWSKAEEDVEKC
ncbi:hypothetical protein MAR_020593 [Mya arenaria]|uniref:Uncharacterized protein n=1 Tax=Mya arenaria TaxID=6604 RepID=A0ABY7E9Z1_MYAAR|nr:hypothetical protein MAR_020593 [Mya arenaria]